MKKNTCCCWGFDHPPCPIHPEAHAEFKSQFDGDPLLKIKSSIKLFMSYASAYEAGDCDHKTLSKAYKDLLKTL